MPTTREGTGPGKLLDWIGSSKKDLDAFPQQVKREIGVALLVAQHGGKHPKTKPLKGFGSGVLEVVEDHDGDTYRAVYTVRFTSYVYVLHAFQKKSKRGIKTPKSDLDLIKQRLADAAELHKLKRRP